MNQNPNMTSEQMGYYDENNELKNSNFILNQENQNLKQEYSVSCRHNNKEQYNEDNKEKIEIDDFRKLSYQMVKVPVKIIDKVNKVPNLLSKYLHK